MFFSLFVVASVCVLAVSIVDCRFGWLRLRSCDLCSFTLHDYHE